jgi:hypothetical protein
VNFVGKIDEDNWGVLLEMVLSVTAVEVVAVSVSVVVSVVSVVVPHSDY